MKYLFSNLFFSCKYTCSYEIIELVRALQKGKNGGFRVICADSDFF